MYGLPANTTQKTNRKLGTLITVGIIIGATLVGAQGLSLALWVTIASWLGYRYNEQRIAIIAINILAIISYSIYMDYADIAEKGSIILYYLLVAMTIISVRPDPATIRQNTLIKKITSLGGQAQRTFTKQKEPAPRQRGFLYDRFTILIRGAITGLSIILIRQYIADPSSRNHTYRVRILISVMGGATYILLPIMGGYKRYLPPTNKK